jgi:cytoskeleton protein RodZ
MQNGSDIVDEPELRRPGLVLRREREALGVTVREVSETLNLAMDTIEAIEADSYDRLPGLVFARGYLRAYARLLELDPEPLLAEYPQAPALMPQPLASESPIWEWIRLRPALVLGGAAVFGFLLLLLLLMWVWPETEVPTEPPASGTGEPLVQGVTPGSNPAGVAPSFGAGNPLPQIAGGAGADSGSSGGFATALQDADGARRITADGDEHMTFTFSDDCWLEIRSATGASLYSDLNRTGETLELVGQGPFRILLGYAPGVRLSFNGESVPLAPHTRNNVATLVLGQ